MPKQAGKPGQANHFTTVSNKVLLAVSNGIEIKSRCKSDKRVPGGTPDQQEEQWISCTHIKSTNVGFRLNELLRYE